MGKSSFPTLLLHGYITAGASVTLERHTCWDNLWPHLLQPVLEKPSELIQKERRSIYSGNLTGILMLTFQMGLLWVFSAPIRPAPITVCYYTHYSTQARSLPQVLAHQQVRESRTHPWDKYVSLSRASLQSSSQTWYFHAACVCDNSRCVSGATAALLQGSGLSGESKLWPHRTLNNVYRSASVLRNEREKRWRFNTEQTDRGGKERLTWFEMSVSLLGKEYI